MTQSAALIQEMIIPPSNFVRVLNVSQITFKTIFLSFFLFLDFFPLTIWRLKF